MTTDLPARLRALEEKLARECVTPQKRYASATDMTGRMVPFVDVTVEDRDEIVSLLREAAAALQGPEKTDPSCHACGGPIELGEPVAVYHEACARNHRQGPVADAPSLANAIIRRACEKAGIVDPDPADWNTDDRITFGHWRAAIEEVLGR